VLVATGCQRHPMRTCIFCGSTPLTREHIFPKWIVEMFPAGEYSHGMGGTDTATQQWNKRNMDSTVRCVCGSCNGGWMSAIEVEAKQVLKHLIAPRPGDQYGSAIVITKSSLGGSACVHLSSTKAEAHRLNSSPTLIAHHFIARVQYHLYATVVFG